MKPDLSDIDAFVNRVPLSEHLVILGFQGTSPCHKYLYSRGYSVLIDDV